MNIIDQFKQFSPDKKFFSNLIKKVVKTNQKSIYSKVQVDQIILKRNKVNDIVFNEKSHIVAVFKDYLILDDEAEFLKR
jgi:hypothetical protein